MPKKIKKIECPKCKTKYTNLLAIYCIKKAGHCPECKKKWEAQPENDPELKRFVVHWTTREDGSTTIYAKSKQEAEDEFKEQCEDDITEIDWIEEVKR